MKGNMPANRRVVLHSRVVADAGGGPEKTVFHSAGYVDPKRWQIEAAYIHPRGDRGIEVVRSQANRYGCPLWEIAESGPIDPRTVWEMWRLCRSLGVSIWHGHDYKSNMLGLLLQKVWPMKLVTTVHGWTRDTARTRVYARIDRWCLKRYDRVIAVSPELADDCRILGVAPDRLAYVPNAIDCQEYHRRHDTQAAKDALGIDGVGPVIGVVGRLSVEKGVDRALKMMAQLRVNNRPAQLHVIGDGPQRGELEAMAQRLNISDRVHFWGWQKRLQPFYEMMDVLLLPSRTEGLANVVLEAMAMGVPVVAADVGGVRELLDDGRCGVILNHNPSQWHQQVNGLLISRRCQEAISRLANVRVRTRYQFVQRMKKIVGVYEDMLGVNPSLQTAPDQRLAA